MSVYFETGASCEGSDKAIIGWQDYGRTGTVTGTAGNGDHDIQNVTDGYTWDYWQPNSTEPIFNLDIGSVTDVDYVAIAAHNLADTCNGNIVIQYSDDGSTMYAAHAITAPSTNDPIIINIVPRSHRYWRVYCTSVTNSDAIIGVLQVGKLLQMQRTIYGGLQVPSLSRKEKIIPNRSETGQFLGQLKQWQFYQSNMSWDNLEPDWYRTNFDPFVVESQTWPFFVAWRPTSYPDEVVFARRTGEIMPTNQGRIGLMSVAMQIEAVK